MPRRDDVSAEELLTCPDYEGCELVAGQLMVAEPVGAGHGQVVSQLLYLLYDHVRANDLGTVFVESGFVLQRRPDTLRGPDISFVAKGRIDPVRLPAGFFEMAPDLAIEVLSPSDGASRMRRKVRDYLGAGTPLVWVVDRDNGCVTVYRGDGTITELDAQDTLDGEDIVPGFRCRLAELFPIYA